MQLAQREARVAALAHLVHFDVARVAQPRAPPRLPRAQLARAVDTLGWVREGRILIASRRKRRVQDEAIALAGRQAEVWSLRQ